MQDHFNLLAREEERKMTPLCLDEGSGPSRGERDSDRAVLDAVQASPRSGE